jgi:DNA (cytosine-5)-methyltransferase 1
MVYGSLFSGIGGFDLGFDRAGLKCAWQVEIDPYCQRVLKKHWPDVPKHEDIRTFKPTPVDVVCGGFPCQDISKNGKGAGIEGEKSGLWNEYVRVIREIRPRFVVVENVEALRFKGRGLYRVLGDLASLRYDAEWHCISAASLGAPHIRERVFIIAWALADNDKKHCDYAGFGTDASRRKWEASKVQGHAESWDTEPTMGRVANGVPSQMVQLGSLGNAVVPQIPEWIGRRLMEPSQPQ